MKTLAAAVLGLLVFGSGAAAAGLDVTLTSPTPGSPVYGEVEVVAEVVRDPGETEEVEAVELRVDGRFEGRRQEEPYRWIVDVGEDNDEHRFEAFLAGRNGSQGYALLVTPRLRVDLEVELELQQLYVTVTSREGARVLDLSRGAFTVLDDGDPQTLVTFERGEVPLTALLLLDASESMRGERLQAALAGARAFIEALAPLDQTKLLLFSDRVVHSTPFTNFSAVLTAGLSGVVAEGGTALNDHLYMALKLLEARQGRRVIVLLTDGLDVASVLSMRDVEWIARRSQALIYWISLGRSSQELNYNSAWRDAAGHREEQRRLEQVIVQSGGRIELLRGIDQIDEAFAEILQELREQYVLGYYPSRSVGDQTWHDVQVRVSNPGLDVRTREGYIDF